MPRYLPREEVERFIAACDFDKAHGVRDRAILLLLGVWACGQATFLTCASMISSGRTVRYVFEAKIVGRPDCLSLWT
jgi:hypothetical protein